MKRGRYGLFQDMNAEERATSLLAAGKRALEVQAILKEESYPDIPPVDEIRQLKKLIHDKTRIEGRDEINADYLLTSHDKFKEKFEETWEKLEKVAERYEVENKPFELTMVIERLIKMLNTVQREFSEQRRQLTRIQAKQINITNMDVMVAIKQNQLKIFNEMDPELKEGKLIINKPSPEFLDDYFQMKRKIEYRKKKEKKKEAEAVETQSRS